MLLAICVVRVRMSATGIPLQEIFHDALSNTHTRVGVTVTSRVGDDELPEIDTMFRCGFAVKT